ISKVFGKIKGQPIPQSFTKGEKEIISRLGGIDEQGTAAVSSKLKATNNPAASALDDLPDSKLRQFVDMAAKDPAVSDDILRVAGQRLDEQPERVNTLLSLHANITEDPE